MRRPLILKHQMPVAGLLLRSLEGRTMNTFTEAQNMEERDYLLQNRYFAVLSSKQKMSKMTIFWKMTVLSSGRKNILFPWVAGNWPDFWVTKNELHNFWHHSSDCYARCRRTPQDRGCFWLYVFELWCWWVLSTGSGCPRNPINCVSPQFCPN